MNHFSLKTKSFLVALLTIGSFFSLKAQTYQSVKQIAERRVPWLASSLSFSIIPSDNWNEVFELSMRNNKIHIGASSASAASSALNWYLKYYCNRSMSHFGDNLSSVTKLPVIKQKIRIVSPYPIRYALNYCTINYSMSFYKWEDWERELDWMALNGVNLMLAPIGMEAVWQNTLRKLGYSEKETLDFIAGPAFSAWWLMGNLEGWGGPVSQDFIDQQAKLQQKILKRMKELEIEPLMHGFYGMIPTTLKTKMDIKVIEQGKWAGGFQRPDFLLTEDPAFSKLADIYYNEMKTLYGRDLRYFGGDPFHEGGSSKGTDVTTSATAIQKVMQDNFPGSTWVLQGWQENPSPKLLDGLNRKKTLVIELFGENTNNWEKRKGYNGTPFVWSNVSNFGEKNGLYGKLQRFANEVYRAKNSQYGAFLKGVGIIPEGIYNNPVTFDLMLELGWHKERVDVKQWIKKYQTSRYGKTTPTLDKAWQLLLETAYSSPEIYQEGPSESIFCARPGIDIKSVSSWGTRKRNYDPAKFKEAVKLFVSASNDFKDIETYQVDKIDFVRQLQANIGDEVYLEMTDAIKAKDAAKFKSSSTKFQQLIMQQDSLLSSSKYFSLNTWLKQALNFGNTAQDKANAIKNAKIQITYWGPDYNAATDLHEYAHKEWGGLLGSLYLSRWKKFTEQELAKMSDSETPITNYFKMDKEWTEDQEMYAPQQLSDKQLNNLINRIVN